MQNPNHRGLELRIIDAGASRSLVVQTEHVPAVGSSMMVDGRHYLVQRSTLYIETRCAGVRPHVVGCVADIAVTHPHAARALDGVVPAFIGAVAGAEFVRRMRQLLDVYADSDEAMGRALRDALTLAVAASTGVEQAAVDLCAEADETPD